MRRLLGAGIVALGLGACGGEESAPIVKSGHLLTLEPAEDSSGSFRLLLDESGRASAEVWDRRTGTQWRYLGQWANPQHDRIVISFDWQEVSRMRVASTDLKESELAGILLGAIGLNPPRVVQLRLRRDGEPYRLDESQIGYLPREWNAASGPSSRRTRDEVFARSSPTPLKDPTLLRDH
jgi:hypothetical protein